MRTTPDIKDDVLAAARDLARRKGTSAGQMVSRLLRAALNGSSASAQPQAVEVPAIGGFRPFPALGVRVVTKEAIDQLRDEAGL